MPEVPVVIHAESGESRPGVAEAIVYGETTRRRRMIVSIVVGVLVGTFCIMVPGPHMLGAWIPPLLGVWLGLRAGKTRAKVQSVAGVCPACSEPVQLPGGGMTGDGLCVPCGKCRAMVTVELA